MDPYVIHKIAIYVKNVKIVKLLYYHDQYREYVNNHDGIYDELVWNYTKFRYHKDIKIIMSLNRQKNKIPKREKRRMIKEIIVESIKEENLEIIQYMEKKASCHNRINLSVLYGKLWLLQYFYEKKKKLSRIEYESINKMIYRKDIEMIKWLQEKGLNKIQIKENIIHQYELINYYSIP